MEEGLLEPSTHKQTDNFRHIVEAHSQQVFRLAFRMVGNEQDAEEVVQETFLKAYRNLDGFDGKSKIGTWLYRIASNCALDLLRSGKRRSTGEEVEADVPETSMNQEDRYYHQQMKAKITHALKDMTPGERAAFTLRHFESYSIAEVSQALGIKPNAAKHAIFRAVRKIRGILQTRSAQ